MSLNSAIYALSNFNAVAGSLNGYNRDTQNGVPMSTALTNMSYNLMGGVLRNAASREMVNETGSYLGYAVNNAAGYGSPEANAQGITGTINAAILSSPFGIFGGYPGGPCMTSSIYGYGPFGGYPGGFFGGGGCCHHNRFMFGGPSFFGMHGFMC